MFVCGHSGSQKSARRLIGLAVVPGKHFVKCEILQESKSDSESNECQTETGSSATLDLSITGTAL